MASSFLFLPSPYGIVVQEEEEGLKEKAKKKILGEED